MECAAIGTTMGPCKSSDRLLCLCGIAKVATVEALTLIHLASMTAEKPKVDALMLAQRKPALTMHLQNEIHCMQRMTAAST